MESESFDQAETYGPEEGWHRVAMAGSNAVSFEWFEKPPGHSSPMQDHENEQISLVTEGELTIHTENDEVTLGPYDSAWLEPWESHHVENTGDEPAVGVDVFTLGRSFHFWLDRE